MSRLPDSLLEDDCESGEVVWEDLIGRWDPPKQSFVASEHWRSALVSLGLPLDETHLGLVPGQLRPPLHENSLSKIQEFSKCPCLLVQVSSPPKDRQIKVADPTGEAFCSVHPKVLSQFSLNEGVVLLLQNTTILPGLVINLTSNNISKIFK